MSNNFWYPHFMAVSGNVGGKVPVVEDVLASHEQEIYPNTWLDKNCIEFEFQTDRNYHVDLRQTYLALKLKLVRGRGYENYNTKEVKKGAQRRKSGRGKGGARGSRPSRDSSKQQIALNSFQCWTLHQQSTKLQLKSIVCAQVLQFQQLQGGHLWIQGSFAMRGVQLSRSSW